MSRLPDDFHQDRALRDAARDVLLADVEHAKTTLSGKAIAGRVAGRMGDGAKDVFEVAKVHATNRQGLIAGLLAIIALWLAREPLAEILGSAASEANEDEAEDSGDDVDQETESALDAGQTELDNSDEDDAEDITPTATPTDPDTDGVEPLSTGEIA